MNISQYLHILVKKSQQNNNLLKIPHFAQNNLQTAAHRIVWMYFTIMFLN